MERRALVAMLSVQEAGWRAKASHLEQLVRDWVQPGDLEQVGPAAARPTPAAGAASAPTGDISVHAKLLADTVAMEALVDEVDTVGQEAWAQARQIASRTLAEGDKRLASAQAELAECHRRIWDEIRPPRCAHEEAQRRRDEAEALLSRLHDLQGGIKPAQLDLKRSKRTLEDLEDDDEVDDEHVEVVQAKEKVSKHTLRYDSLVRQREGLILAITDLAVGGGNEGDGVENLGAARPQNGGPQEEAGDPGDTTLVFEFPELPVRARRTIAPFKATLAELSPRDRNRLDVEALLRRDGLLVEARSHSDYCDEDLPDTMLQATRGKPNVTGRRLRGVPGLAGLGEPAFLSTCNPPCKIYAVFVWRILPGGTRLFQ
jgi:predicted metal-dependent hydrolase